MRRTKMVLLGAVGLGGALVGWLELFRRGRQSRCVLLRETVAAAPAELFERLCDVEAEPRLVPGVESVTILEREPCAVSYRIEGQMAGTPWWAVFRKEWEQAPGILTWEGEGGTLELRQVGHLRLEGTADGTLATLVACTRFDFPVLGPLATLTCGPLYLHAAFRSWLRNAARDAGGHLRDLVTTGTEGVRG